MIEAIQAFKASDGTIHESKFTAAKHNLSNLLFDIFDGAYIVDDLTNKLTQHSAEFIKLLVEIQELTPPKESAAE